MRNEVSNWQQVCFFGLSNVNVDNKNFILSRDIVKLNIGSFALSENKESMHVIYKHHVLSTGTLSFQTNVLFA